MTSATRARSRCRVGLKDEISSNASVRGIERLMPTQRPGSAAGGRRPRQSPAAGGLSAIQELVVQVDRTGTDGAGAPIDHAEITERKQLEEELAAIQEWQRLVFEIGSDMVSVHARDSSFIFVSAACRALLGYEPEALIGRPVIGMIHPADLNSAHATHGRLLAGSKMETIDCRYRRKDGRYVWVEAM